MAVMSCSKLSHNNQERTAQLDKALRAIDDSLSANAASTLTMIQQGLSHTKDSLAYCDYYIRYIRHNVTFCAEDTFPHQWNKLASHLSQQQPTPRIYGMLGYLYNTRGFYEMKFKNRAGKKTMLYFCKAYQYLQKSDAKQSMPDVCANIGDAYINTNNLPQAAMWYRRALFLADSLKLSDKSAITLYMGLGRIYVALADFDAALKCYQQADKQIQLLPLNMQIYFLNNYGNYYYYDKKYAEALRNFLRLKRLLIHSKLENSIDMYVCKLNMADTYLNLGNTKLAYDNLNQSEAFFNKIDYKLALYYCHTVRIGLALRQGNTAEVERILSSEGNMGNIEYNMVNIRQRYLREYYVKTGQYKKAYDNLVESNACNDSLQHNITHMRTAEIMMRYTNDTLSLHHHIEMQKKDAHIRKVQWFSFGVAMLTLTLIFLVLYLLTLIRKRRLQTSMQLMELKLQNARNRISPHFIFNVLNNRISHTSQQDADELMALAKLIRANLNMSGKFYITLKEELDFVKYYISVERHNIGSDFTFELHAPEDSETQQVAVPSMFIQILTENAIKHGLKGKEGPKRLSVNVQKGTGTWINTVTDNGPGFDIRRTNPDSTKTGLRIIRSTISAINRTHKHKLKMSINNLKDSSGQITGCQIAIELPDDLKPTESC